MRWFTSLVLLAIACESNKPSPSPAPVVSAEPPAPPAATSVAEIASAAPSASVAVAPTAAPTAAPESTHASKPKAASSGTATAPSVAPAASAAPAAEPIKSASKHLTGKNFALDLASAGCHAGSECAMTIKLTAGGEFHVNKEYPYKFTASATPNVTFLGKGDATTFSRASGDFAEQGEKTATMTVRFKPSSAGDANVSGTYKLSVCSADQCQVEQQAVDLVVPVM